MLPAFAIAPPLPLALRHLCRALHGRPPLPTRRPRAALSPASPASQAAATTAASPLATAAPSTLYIVSTPIGNALDLSPRAARILATVDVIAAEDTRRAGLLLQRARPAGAPPRAAALVSCHAHNWRARAPELLARLRAGGSVAVVSDAGTPAVSDPGAEVVRVAVEAGVRVVPVPGACAALAALVCAGLPAGVDFVVVGFVDRSGKGRAEAFARVWKEYAEAAVVLYEAPHRLVGTLVELAEGEAGAGGGLRSVCLAREVTKKFEEIQYYGSLAEAVQPFIGEGGAAAERTPRGEYTIVLGPRVEVEGEGKGEGEVSAERAVLDGVCAARDLIRSLVLAGTPTSTVAKAVSGSSKLSRKTVYAYASQVREEMRLGTGDVAVR